MQLVLCIPYWVDKTAVEILLPCWLVRIKDGFIKLFGTRFNLYYNRLLYFCLQYTFLLLFVFLLEAIVGGLAYFYESHITDELVETLNSTFTIGYAVDPDKTRAIDEMQQEVSEFDNKNQFYAILNVYKSLFGIVHVLWCTSFRGLETECVVTFKPQRFACACKRACGTRLVLHIDVTQLWSSRSSQQYSIHGKGSNRYKLHIWF